MLKNIVLGLADLERVERIPFFQEVKYEKCPPHGLPKDPFSGFAVYRGFPASFV
jgi:hypothetical protein